ncbi:DUF883 family protein [Hydrogenophaga sp. A37]|uniref:hypothetical protein n=1 Tax=Hydrogenophaga sp. A37 TaxID=1945864 RepID=UPI00098549CF|nr:hypothetical protein [Hydrogenophaga sp. A37]OOG80902.1 hypothetical protein B0E41_19405 [Hydrogenophaga sp. A37]
MPDTTVHPTSIGSAPRDSQGQDLLNRATETAHGAVDRFADKAGPAVQKLESGMAQANAVLHDQAHHMRELSDEWANSARDTVRQHPLTSVLLALAAGALIARASR